MSSSIKVKPLQKFSKIALLVFHFPTVKPESYAIAVIIFGFLVSFFTDF